MARTESEFAGKHGTKIVYDTWTPDGDSAGFLVLAHGLGEHARRYDHVIERLTALGLTVYAPDHRGHGRSGGKRVELKDWSDFTDDLHQLFGIASAAQPGARKFLLGHSMGGAIALSYALDHQSDLAALMLSGPAVVLSPDISKLKISAGKIVGRLAPNLPVEELDSNALSHDPAVIAAYNADPLVWHGKVPAGLARGLVLASEGFPARLPSLTLPLLLQHGSEDKLADVSGSRLVADRAGSKDITLKVYDGLYHEIFNEPEQDRILDDLVAWLAPRVSSVS